MELLKTVRTCLKHTISGHIVGHLIFVCSIMQRASFGSELQKFTTCNSALNMDQQSIQQAQLELVIRDFESSGTRVSCDFTIQAGLGKQVMFYFTDVYLGSPNKTDWIDRSCVEIRDVNGYYETVPKGLRAIVCTNAEVEIAPRVYATEGNALSIRFYRNRGFSIKTYIKIVFTVFRQGSCRTSERKCGNGHCIAHDIVCNNHNPCGDGSDCPTGLEQLSSWAMSGIVILALLSGGIVIIMATVCLQRSGRKRDNWDDSSTAVNGVYRQDTNVELMDIADASAVKHTPQGSQKKRNVPYETYTPENLTSYHEHSHIISGSKQSFNENDHLIQSNMQTSLPITCMCSMELAQTDKVVPIDMFTTADKKTERSETITTSLSSYKIDGPTTDDVSHRSLQPEIEQTHLNQSHSDLFNFSETGLVLTNGDSGQEVVKIDNFTQKTSTFKPLTMTLNENGNYETKTLDSLPNNSPYLSSHSYNMLTKTKTKYKFPISSNEFKSWRLNHL